MIILGWSVHMCMLVCWACAYVFMSLKQQPTLRGHDIFHNTCIASVFLWINFSIVCVVCDCIASLIWPHVSNCNITYSQSLGGKRLRLLCISSPWLGLYPQDHGPVSVRLGKPLKDRAHFSRAVGQKDPFHSIAESQELSLSSPPFIKLLFCSE